MSALLPEASSIAPRVDVLFWYMVGLCGFVVVGIFSTMIYLAVKYRKGSKADRSGKHKQSIGIEATWTLVPFGMFLAVFIWSLFIFARLHSPPKNAQTVYVVAKQWMWKIQHPGGQREIDMLHVPLGETTRLVMISQDVIHSFGLPAFRLKQDVLPGMYTDLWFRPTETGRFSLFCDQYCGLDHSKMIGQVVVMSPAAYARWLEKNPAPESVAAHGAALFRSAGCSGCHGANASVHAPDLDGLYGRPVHLADGSTVVADDRYIHDSILLPDKQIVAGFAPIMPSFQGQLSEEEILALVAYIKSTSATAHQPPSVGSESTHERH